jgi:hypothetical protein
VYDFEVPLVDAAGEKKGDLFSGDFSVTQSEDAGKRG